MKVLGCDPGIHGGLAIVKINDGTAPQLVDAIEVVIMLCRIPMTIIEPTAWKKFHGLRGGEEGRASHVGLGLGLRRGLPLRWLARWAARCWR